MLIVLTSSLHIYHVSKCHTVPGIYCECQLPLLSFATIDTITAICMDPGIGKAGKKPTGILLSFIVFPAFMAGKLKVTLLLLSLYIIINFYFVLSCE